MVLPWFHTMGDYQFLGVFAWQYLVRLFLLRLVLLFRLNGHYDSQDAIVRTQSTEIQIKLIF